MHPEIELRLEGFGPRALETFMEIERPEVAIPIEGEPTEQFPAEDVTIHLNEELYVWKDELTVHRGDTLTISVRDLAAGSKVEIIAEKGGISVGRKVFYSNHKGELDLEIRTGNKKMKGGIDLNYTASGGAKKQKSVHLIVD